jgi:hypothetical protein
MSYFFNQCSTCNLFDLHQHPQDNHAKCSPSSIKQLLLWLCSLVKPFSWPEPNNFVGRLSKRRIEFFDIRTRVWTMVTQVSVPKEIFDIPAFNTTQLSVIFCIAPAGGHGSGGGSKGGKGKGKGGGSKGGGSKGKGGGSKGKGGGSKGKGGGSKGKGGGGSGSYSSHGGSY